MPDRNRNRIGGGPDFEIAYYTKELGKPLQRQMLQKQLARLSRHGNDADKQADDPEVPLDAAEARHDAAPPLEDSAA